MLLSTLAVIAGSAIVVGGPQEPTNLLMPPTPSDSGDKQVFAAYSRKRGAYHFDIAIYEIAAPTAAGRFYAHLLNIVRIESGQTVAVNAELEDVYAATPEGAYATLEAAVEAWVKEQTPSD